MAEQHYLMDTYQRAPLGFVSGQGCLLRGSDGREYLDCLGGIAVVSSGHANPLIAQVVAEQAAKLVHVSNLFEQAEQQALAKKLHEISGGWGRVFFANSGAEANECALKLARLWAGPGRFKVICAERSFHGRTLATLAATGQPSKWEGFEPLPVGFVHAPFNDAAAFAAAVDEQTAAIMVEPILGEGGVIPAEPAFLQALRELCDSRGLALIFDEVQSGMGRTGRWWAFQGYGVQPDIFTSAKALANGLPIGACIAATEVAAAFKPGRHGSTFGGGPLICRAALANIQYLEEGGYVPAAAAKGELLQRLLRELPRVVAVRGRGLLQAAQLDQPIAQAVTNAARESGLLINNVTPDTLRLAPPLVISTAEIERAAAILKTVLIREA